MNKKLRKIITCTLMTSALCTILPTSNLLIVRTYASSTDGTKLKDINLNHGHIDFSSSDYTYEVNVSESVNKIKITAIPQVSASTVKIDDHTVNDSDCYTETVSLDKGKNTIDIKVKDNSSNCENIYILNIFRSTTINIPIISYKKNQWVFVNGHMQYIDASGNPLKNTWFWDGSIKKYHFLNNNGYMHTGWLFYNSRWYYLDENGIMLTGWQYLNGNWYYLSYGGEMITGWFEDSDGIWYYLDNNGIMLTGWILNNGKYYHLTSSGAMDHNKVVDGFKLGPDGAWIGR